MVLKVLRTEIVGFTLVDHFFFQQCIVDLGIWIIVTRNPRLIWEMIEIHNTVKFLIQSIVMGGAFIGEVASLVNSHSGLLLLVVM